MKGWWFITFYLKNVPYPVNVKMPIDAAKDFIKDHVAPAMEKRAGILRLMALGIPTEFAGTDIMQYAGMIRIEDIAAYVAGEIPEEDWKK